MKQHRPEVVDQCIAQVRKWQGSADNGWAPTRLQAGVLADEVERLRAEIELWVDYEGRVRDVVSEYVNDVESGEKFDALLALLEDTPAATVR